MSSISLHLHLVLQFLRVVPELGDSRVAQIGHKKCCVILVCFPWQFLCSNVVWVLSALFLVLLELRQSQGARLLHLQKSLQCGWCIQRDSTHIMAVEMVHQ